MEKTLKLKGARVALTATHAEQMDLTIQRGRFLPLGDAAASSDEIDLSGHLVLPGLINAHDHLDFALFPRLGRGPWANASEWAAEIHKPDESPVKEHLTVPKRVRMLWGSVRNLIAGVTTVAHHNPWEPEIFNRAFPIRVVRRFGWAHSLDFSPDIQSLYRKTPARLPFIVHAGEGIDTHAAAEIPRLAELGILSRRTIVVHAVATHAELLREKGAAVVWCPSSNLFTLGRSLAPETLRSGLFIALGTDSPLTAQGDMIDEVCVAARHLPLEEIYPLVSTNSARILRLDEGQGLIRSRGVADVVAVKDTGQTPAEALRHLLPELVLIGGRTMLVNPALGLPAGDDLHEIALEGRGKWLVRVNIPKLREAASTALGRELHLGGKRVC
jgi:cytosine/adenosine deaminase-related metal-dependent hydrolase